MRGKYSPTVSSAYSHDQDWHRKFCNLAPYGDVIYSPYDPEGFNSYGYDKDNIDRAGNHENNYAHNDGDYDRDEDYNNRYDIAYDEWGFDGTKPAKRGE
jgi:hypothetical protein